MARQSALLTGTPVLLTRPKAEADRFAAALTARLGARVRPVVAPLLAPRLLTPDLPDRDYAAVLFTSAQAVWAAARLADRLPKLAWCVGDRTAEAAKAGGFQARSAQGDADRLISALIADPPAGRILYLHGVDTRGNILERLSAFGLPCDELVVYIQESQNFGHDALRLFDRAQDVIVPLFSPRTAALFRAALPATCRARLHVAAMSPAVAEALAGLSVASLVVAAQPDAKAMLDAVESLLAGAPPP